MNKLDKGQHKLIHESYSNTNGYSMSSAIHMFDDDKLKTLMGDQRKDLRMGDTMSWEEKSFGINVYEGIGCSGLAGADKSKVMDQFHLKNPLQEEKVLGSLDECVPIQVSKKIKLMEVSDVLDLWATWSKKLSNVQVWNGLLEIVKQYGSSFEKDNA